MPSGWTVALLVSSLLGTGAVVGVATMNGEMMQGHMMGGGPMMGSGHSDCQMESINDACEGMHCGSHHELHEGCEEHEYRECEGYQRNHQNCEEEMEEQSDHLEEHEEGHHSCGVMG
ncbi:MAG: hypothetical protein ACE5KV_03380 [Thermoplasmata archaeon]